MHMLGEDAIQLIKETIEEDDDERWTNRLGMIKIGDGHVAIRPRKEHAERVGDTIEESDVYAACFEHYQPLFGTAGCTYQDTLSVVHTDHPIVQIATGTTII